MKRITAILLSAAIIFTLTACQKTPETPIVQEKNVDRLIEKAGGEQASEGNNELTQIDLAEKLGVPERYVSQRTYPSEKLTLNADAEITLPNYAMPVVRIEPAEFSQEFVNKVYDVLIGDTPMFEQPEGTISQSEIEKMRSEIHTDYYPISIGEVANMYRDNEIFIHPEFQRFYRWTDGQKSRFIESILLGIPIPSLFVAAREDSIWVTVHGFYPHGKP
jgi:hypothetical protein